MGTSRGAGNIIQAVCAGIHRSETGGKTRPVINWRTDKQKHEAEYRFVFFICIN
jgi:hypothetical protein